MAQLVKCMQYLSSVTKTHMKRQAWWCILKIRALERQIGRSLEVCYAASLAYLVSSGPGRKAKGT